jgi:hypothetical protein
MAGRGLLAITILAVAIPHATAQSGTDPAATQAECQELLTRRDELQKHGKAIGEANDKKAHVTVACRLFRTYLATEARMLRLLETHGAQCGVPSQVNLQVRTSHAKAQQIGRQVCDAAYPRPRFDDRRFDGPEPLRIDPLPFKMGGAA